MRRHRHVTVLQKTFGVLIAIGGLALIVKTLPLYLWPLLLGLFLIWLGWNLYAVGG